MVAMIDIRDLTPLLQRIAGAVRRIAQLPKTKEETPRPPEKPGQESRYEGYLANAVCTWDVSCSCRGDRCLVLVLLHFGNHSCIAGDTEAGRVQTFVGFGASKEEAEKNALGSCSHIQLDLQTCLDSDRILGRNAPSDEANSSLHLKYTKAVKRVTGCD
jgi:hypothetical protein